MFFYGRISQAGLCDGSQSKISFLCVRNPQRSEYCASPLVLKFVLNKMDNALFVAPRTFCLRLPFINLFGLITWHGRVFSGPPTIFILTK